MQEQGRLSIGEVFGLVSLESVKQGVRGIRGDATTPKHVWDLSTLKILQPSVSIKTWLKLGRTDKRIPIYNYFNRTPVSQENGYSLRVSQVQDFRGGQQTYDSHQGTDFIIPVGTTVTAAAPGVVVRVEREFDRGGLSVMLLHSHGLITTHNHLGRPLVQVGDEVKRGQPIAISGASGLDFVTSFFLSPPHVHFNTWLNGQSVDPFAIGDEDSLWLNGNQPLPSHGDTPSEELVDVDALFDKEAVSAGIEQCLDADMRRMLNGFAWLPERAAHLIYQRNYRPSKFSGFETVYRENHVRVPYLNLPFQSCDVSGLILD